MIFSFDYVYNLAFYFMRQKRYPLSVATVLNTISTSNNTPVSLHAMIDKKAVMLNDKYSYLEPLFLSESGYTDPLHIMYHIDRWFEGYAYHYEAASNVDPLPYDEIPEPIQEALDEYDKRIFERDLRLDERSHVVFNKRCSYTDAPEEFFEYPVYVGKKRETVDTPVDLDDRKPF